MILFDWVNILIKTVETHWDSSRLVKIVETNQDFLTFLNIYWDILTINICVRWWLFDTVKIETKSRQIETPSLLFLTFFCNLKLKINVWLEFAWRQTEFAFARYGWTSVQCINFLSTLFETTRPSLLELNYPLKVSLKWKSSKMKIKSVSLFCKNIMQCLRTFNTKHNK